MWKQTQRSCLDSKHNDVKIVCEPNDEIRINYDLGFNLPESLTLMGFATLIFSFNRSHSDYSAQVGIRKNSYLNSSFTKLFTRSDSVYISKTLKLK